MEENVIELIGRVLLWLLFLLIVGSTAYATYSEENQLPPNIFTGRAFLEIRSDAIKITAKRDITSLELFFDSFGETENKGTIDLSEDPTIEVDVSDDRIAIRSKDGSPFENDVVLLLNKSKNVPRVFVVNSVAVHGNDVSTYEFIQSYASLSPFRNDDGSIELRYEYSLGSLGYLFANRIANFVPPVVIWLLTPLALIQLGLLVVRLLSFVPFAGILKKTKSETLDLITHKLAIPLGLLGTVAAIWSVFELLSMDLGKPHTAIQILSNALFTTFLAMVSYGAMTCRLIMDGESDEP